LIPDQFWKLDRVSKGGTDRILITSRRRRLHPGGGGWTVSFIHSLSLGKEKAGEDEGRGRERNEVLTSRTSPGRGSGGQKEERSIPGKF